VLVEATIKAERVRTAAVDVEDTTLTQVSIIPEELTHVHALLNGIINLNDLKETIPQIPTWGDLVRYQGSDDTSAIITPLQALTGTVITTHTNNSMTGGNSGNQFGSNMHFFGMLSLSPRKTIKQTSG
jgi:hypothetical protein